MIQLTYEFKKNFLIVGILILSASSLGTQLYSVSNDEGPGIEPIDKNTEEIPMYPYLVPALKNKAKYSAFNLVDGRKDSWCIGKQVLNDRGYIILDFLPRGKGYHIKDLYIINGLANPKNWKQYNRIKQIRIKVGSIYNTKKYTFNLKDQYENHVTLPPIFDTSIVIEILSVYPGTKYDNTCIAEVSFSPIKHTDLLESKFKRGAKLRDRDFWGRSINGFVLGDYGEITYPDQDPDLGYMPMVNSSWHRENGYIIAEIIYSGTAPHNNYIDIRVHKLKVPEKLLIKDPGGRIEVSDKYYTIEHTMERQW